MNPIRKVVELLLDRASARRTEAEAQRALDRATDPKRGKRNLSQLDSAIDGLQRTAKRVGAAVAAAFAFDRIKDFLVGSLRAAGEADAIWNRLGATVESAGVNFAQVRGELQQAAQAFARATPFDDESFAETLTRLVDISGDYEGSLRNVSLVADLASRKQMSLETAAMLVGRVMNGNTAILTRHGIEVSNNANAIEELRASFSGAAENELNTTAGKVKQLANFWGDLREAVGTAIATSPGVSGFFDSIYNGAMGAAGGVDHLTDSIGSWIDTLMRFGAVKSRLGPNWWNASPQDFGEAWKAEQDRNRAARQGMRAATSGSDAASQRALIERLRRQRNSLPPATEDAAPLDAQIAAAVAHLAALERPTRRTRPAAGRADAATARADAARREVDLLERGAQLNALSAAEHERARALYDQTNAQLAAGNLTLEQRVQLLQQLLNLSGALLPNRTPAIPDEAVISNKTPTLPTLAQGLRRPISTGEQIAQQMRDMLGPVETLEAAIAGGLTNAMFGFGDAAVQAFQAVAEGSISMGQAFADVMLQSLAQVSRGLGDHYMARSVAALAEGIGGDPRGFAAAGQFFAAATLMYALAGGISGAGRGGRGGGGSVHRGAGVGGRSADLAERPEKHTYLILRGQWDGFSVEFEDNTHRAMDRATQRRGLPESMRKHIIRERG